MTRRVAAGLTLLALAAAAPGGLRAEEGRLSFAGREWLVVDDAEPRGPGPNRFDARNARLDRDGRLILETARRGGRWTAAQLFLAESLGHGVYELELEGLRRDLDPLAVLGFYTWDEDPAFANRELDLELSRWGRADAPNLQFVVQPADGPPGRLARFRLDASRPFVLRLEWLPGLAKFSARYANEVAPAAEWSFPGAGAPGPAEPFGVPPPGRERIGLNLWLMEGRAPARADRLAIRDFRFTPAAPVPAEAAPPAEAGPPAPRAAGP